MVVSNQGPIWATDQLMTRVGSKIERGGLFNRNSVSPSLKKINFPQNRGRAHLRHLFEIKRNAFFNVTGVCFFQNPPPIVKLVMEAVCVMLAIKADRKPDPTTGKMGEDFWGPSMKLLGDLRFLDKLKTYDKDNIAPPIMKKIRDR